MNSFNPSTHSASSTLSKLSQNTLQHISKNKSLYIAAVIVLATSYFLINRSKKNQSNGDMRNQRENKPLPPPSPPPSSNEEKPARLQETTNISNTINKIREDVSCYGHHTGPSNTPYLFNTDLVYFRNSNHEIIIQNKKSGEALTIPLEILKQAIQLSGSDVINQFISQRNFNTPLDITLNHNDSSIRFFAPDIGESKEHALYILPPENRSGSQTDGISLTDGDARALRRLIRILTNIY